MKFILKNLEPVFTFAGLLVVFFAVAILEPKGISPWKIAAIAAILVGVVHGGLFWLVRWRQRQVRRVVIADVQVMLHDIINNQLAVILAMSNLREAHVEETKRAGEYISRSVSAISEALKHLSDESLRSWLDIYRSSDSAAPFSSVGKLPE